MNAALSQFVQVVKRIPLFESLQTEHVVALLKVCDRCKLEPRETLCVYGDPSKEMYILLNGELSVRTAEGVQFAKIKPIAPVGEMGIFTGEPRSATVLASETSSLLVLSKAKLDMFMRRNPPIEIAISRSLITTLSQRLRTANQEISHLQHLIADQGAKPEDVLDDASET
ncbi:MAG: Crp/Fnr family transcriptional regulator [Candidatus Latescibacterota bacterium]|jgi:CRP/FNR family cyclic AMP-dependent transcriptional regulator